MQDHGLTQAEVDSLLARRPRSGRVTRTDRPHLAPRDIEDVQSLAADQLSALRAMHQPLGSSISELLTHRLGTTVQARMLGIDQVSAEQFSRELPGPHVFQVLRARPLDASRPLEDPWLLALPLAMVLAILNRLLGGGGDTGPVVPAPLTELETRLLTTITERLVDQLATAWSPWLELSATLEGVLANPGARPPLPHQELVARVAWHVQWQGVSVQIRLAIPGSSLKRVSETFLAPDAAVDSGSRTTYVEAERKSAVEAGKLPVLVCLEQSRIRLSEARQLAVGDVIATDQDCNGPLTVYVDGQPRYLGLPAAFQGQKVVQIEKVLGEGTGVRGQGTGDRGQG